MKESDPYSCQKTNFPFVLPSNFDIIGSDLTELILSHLPISSIVRAASVCSLWNSIIHSRSFKTLVSDNSKRLPWLFLSGQNNNFASNNRVLAFDPESNTWIETTNDSLLFKDSFTASSGYFFTTGPGEFRFKRVLNGPWCQGNPLRFPRFNPLISVYNEPECSKLSKIIVVGGLVNREDCLAVEIYNPHCDSWELCPPLPEIFRPGNSSQSLCSAVFKEKLFVYNTYSCFISSLDLKSCLWSHTRTLRPPGKLISFLISCQDRLILAGLCSINNELEFNLWNINERTLEFSEIGIMPQELLSCLFDNEGEQKFASLKCLGLGNLVYIFNEECHWNYPACICEISTSGKCMWRRIPSFPESVKNFQKVISFCSNVSLEDILGNRME